MYTPICSMYSFNTLEPDDKTFRPESSRTAVRTHLIVPGIINSDADIF